jgi:hypothetical protein
MGCGTCGDDEGGSPIAKTKEGLETADQALQIALAGAKRVAGLAGEKIESALEYVEGAEVLATTGKGDPEEGGAAGAAVEVAKNFQPLAGSPLQVAKARVELDADGNVVVKTPFGDLPPPPVLAPTKRKESAPEPSLLPDIVIPGSGSGIERDV